MNQRFLSILFILLSVISMAQTKPNPKAKQRATLAKTGFKIGYIFEDYIFENYHELQKLDAEIKTKQKEMEDQYNALAIDYQTKYLDYQSSVKNIDSLTTEKINEKIKNVQKAKSLAENFQRDAEKELQKLTGEGISYVKNKVETATKTVAKERNYPYVLIRNKTESLMKGNKMVLYYNDQGQHNISDAVLAKLGSVIPKKQ